MGHPNLRDRDRSIRWAREWLSRPKDYVIWDTETTGITQRDEIIQIGILAPDGLVLLESFVRPLIRKAIPPEATAIHGITMERLAGAPVYPQVAPLLAGVLKGKSAVAYNVDFERRLLRQTATLTSVPSVQCRWECAMTQYSRFVGEWMYSRSDYKWQKLPNVAHSAIADCRATLALIKKMAATALS